MQLCWLNQSTENLLAQHVFVRRYCCKDSNQHYYLEPGESQAKNLFFWDIQIIYSAELITQAQKIVVWKLLVSLQNLRWNFIFILLRLLLSKNFGCCCLIFLKERSWLVKRFTPHGQLTNQHCSLKQAELTVEPLITIFCIL